MIFLRVKKIVANRKISRWFTQFVCISLAGATVFSPRAKAEYILKDPEQRKSWYYLQHLAMEIAEADTCITTQPSRSRTPKRDQELYKELGQQTAELADVIEAYVAKYASKTNPDESVSAFRYRVWSVTLRVGEENARKLLDPQFGCIGVLSSLR